VTRGRCRARKIKPSKLEVTGLRTARLPSIRHKLRLSTEKRKFDDVFTARMTLGPPGRPETPRPRASPSPARRPSFCDGRPGVRASRHRRSARRPRGGLGDRQTSPYVRAAPLSPDTSSPPWETPAAGAARPGPLLKGPCIQEVHAPAGVPGLSRRFGHPALPLTAAAGPPDTPCRSREAAGGEVLDPAEIRPAGLSPGGFAAGEVASSRASGKRILVTPPHLSPLPPPGADHLLRSD
jgi:hypothetical protein